MSQVIVEEDNLKEKREKSRELERKIQIEGVHQKWHLGGTAGVGALAKMIAIAGLPVIALWTGIGILIGAAFKIIGGLFRFIGGFISKKSDTASH